MYYILLIPTLVLLGGEKAARSALVIKRDAPYKDTNVIHIRVAYTSELPTKTPKRVNLTTVNKRADYF
jgi:hypothetical protein